MKKNIFLNMQKNLDKELIETILKSKDIKIERIVSKNYSSPKDFWYNQKENEFILLINGQATLQFEDKFLDLKKGDYLIIPAHTKHRVEKTDNETIWLTVFYN